MTNRVGFSPGSRRRSLPPDLSWYIGKKTLVQLILEILEPRLTRPSLERSDHGFQPAVMLTLLTYCYVTGVYGSADIELNTRRDPMTRYLCAKVYPNLDMIRSFRRDYRHEITHCLASVLERVWELRFCGDDAVPMEGPDASRRPRTETMAGPDFWSEAQDRLAQAVRADSMALDV